MSDKPSDKSDTGKLHCFRCHESFDPKKNTLKSCTIEHDQDLFEGCREGEWYEGVLTCCGAEYRFHRYYSEEEMSAKYCFQGEHAADPSMVEYNESTIPICQGDPCGHEHHQRSKMVYEAQNQARAAVKAGEKRATEEHWKKRIEEAPPDKKRREERKARAARLGLYDGTNSDEFDSDEHSDSCVEFDCASDSSLCYDF